MKILGLDPGLGRLGYGLIAIDSKGPHYRTCGVISTAKEASLTNRLVEIHRDLGFLLREFQPNHVAIEELFFGRNVTNGIQVAHARGVTLLTLAQAGLTAAEYKPVVIKQHVAGSGGASKPEVLDSVMALLGLAARPKPDDAGDALAIALTHYYHLTSGANLRRN